MKLYSTATPPLILESTLSSSFAANQKSPVNPIFVIPPEVVNWANKDTSALNVSNFGSVAIVAITLKPQLLFLGLKTYLKPTSGAVLVTRLASIL